jgi:hypothetical protein
MEARRRLMIALLVPVGVWLGHALAYALVGVPAAEAAHRHGYLGMAPTLTVPSALVAVAWWAAGRRGRRARLPGALPLAAVQLALFLVQEAVEQVAATGNPLALLSAPVLWWGLGAQALVAVLLVLLVRGARRTVEAWQRRPAARPARRAVARPARPAVASARRRHRTPASRRGPPRRLAPAPTA